MMAPELDEPNGCCYWRASLLWGYHGSALPLYCAYPWRIGLWLEDMQLGSLDREAARILLHTSLGLLLDSGGGQGLPRGLHMLACPVSWS